MPTLVKAGNALQANYTRIDNETSHTPRERSMSPKGSMTLLVCSERSEGRSRGVFAWQCLAVVRRRRTGRNCFEPLAGSLWFLLLLRCTA